MTTFLKNIKSSFPFVLFLFFCLISVKRLWQIDGKDAKHPFGGDDVKLKRYLKRKYKKSQIDPKFFENFLHEDHGVMTFWGKPEKTDSIKNSLSKIEWLGNNYKDQIVWRKCLICAILASIFIWIIVGINKFKVTKAIAILFALYVIFYGIRNYEGAHFYKIKARYIYSNVDNIRKKLKIGGGNDIVKLLG